MSLSAGGYEVDVLDVGSLTIAMGVILPMSQGPVALPMNVLLLRGDGRTILVDAGAGVAGPWYEQLTEDVDAALAGAGASREDVDLVVLSHLDFDHVGGLLAGTWPDALEPAFPRARVAALRSGIDHWRAADPDSVMNAATRAVRLLEERGLLDAVEDDGEAAPGIRLRPIPGHSPGHAMVEIGEGADALVFVADAIHHPVHAENPEWDYPFDADPHEALRSRRAVLAEAADRGCRVVAAHIAGPGRVERAGESYRWLDA